MVMDGRTLAAALPDAPADPRAYLLAFHPEAAIPPTDDVDEDAAPLVARVNHGVWIASCPCGAPGLPAPGCVVFLDAPLGWCVRCGNAETGGRWRPVLLPPADERTLIEAVLAARPDPATRSWEPHETIAALVAENAAHGLAVE